MSSSLLGNNNEQFLHRIVMCDEKWILCNNQRWPAQWLDWEEAPKHFPKPSLHPKGPGHYLIFCCWSDTLQLSESWWNHYIWEACLANWSVQFSSVQSISHVRLFVTPWIAACPASLSITNSRSLLKLMSIELVMPPKHLVLCHPLLLMPSIFPSIKVFSRVWKSLLKTKFNKY